MTEDDTFNKLRKLTFDEIREVYSREYKQKRWNQTTTGLEEAEEVCKRHGWTYSEFLDAVEGNNYRKIYD